VEPTQYPCPTCGSPMVLRQVPRGPFLVCSAYPKCRTCLDTDAEGRPIQPPDTGVQCERCGSPMVVRRGRREVFLGCSAYPKCRETKPLNAQA
jgi:DNA topoisomerase-1